MPRLNSATLPPGYHVITSSAAILAGIFTTSLTDSRMGGPSLHLLVPVEQYRKVYRFRAIDDLNNVLLVVAESNGQVWLNGAPVIPTPTVIAAGGSGPVYYGLRVSVGAGQHVVTSTSRFTATLHAYGSEQCSIAFRIGQCYYDLQQSMTPTTSPTTTTPTTTTPTTTTPTTTTPTTTTPTTTTPTTTTPTTTTPTTTTPTTTTPTTTTPTTTTPTTTTPTTTTTTPTTTTPTITTPISATPTVSPNKDPRTCSSSMRGSSFFLLFPETANEGVDQRLHVTASHDSACFIRVSGSTAFSPASFYLSAGQTRTLDVPHALQTQGIGVSLDTLMLTSSGCLFTARTQTGGDGSCGAYQAPPVLSYGTDYRVAAWWPDVGGQNYGQIDVVAAYNNTVVTISILRGKGVVLMYGGVAYDQNNQIRVTLRAGQLLQLQNKLFNDMSGTRIQSTLPVGVVSGLLQTNIGPNGRVDHALEQMPPVNTWGRRFGFVSHSANAKYRVKVICATAFTTLSYNGFTNTVRQAGDFATLEFTGAAWLSSNHPVLVTMFSEGTARDSPSMILVPHVDQFRTSYTVSAVQSESYAAIVRHKNDNSITLDGVSIANMVQWYGVNAEWRVGRLGLLPGDHVISTMDKANGFGTYIYTSAGNGRCSSAFTPDMCMDATVSIHYLVLYIIYRISIY